MNHQPELVRDYFDNTLNKLEIGSLETRLPAFREGVTFEEFQSLTNDLQSAEGVQVVKGADGTEYEFDRVTLVANQLGILTQSSIGNLIRLREAETTRVVRNQSHRIFVSQNFTTLLEQSPELFKNYNTGRQQIIIEDFRARFKQITNLSQSVEYTGKIPTTEQDYRYRYYIGILTRIYNDLNFITGRVIDSIANPETPTEMKDKGKMFLWNLIDNYHNKNNIKVQSQAPR